jgi:predicted component of type VI protein secretion system
MASEYNLEAAILATLAKFPLRVKLHHVLSHQDKQQPNILKLKWEAQLNVI